MAVPRAPCRLASDPSPYTAQSIMTAIREANQIGTLQRTTLVAYQADLDPVFDATDRQATSPADPRQVTGLPFEW